MPESHPESLVGIQLVGLHYLRKRWDLFLGLGAVLLILGIVALVWSVAFTLASVVFIGWLLIVGGVLQTAHAFMGREWGGHVLDLLTGILYAVVGFLIVSHPAATAETLTLMIAVMLIVGGIFRLALATTVRFHNAVWLLLQGAINVALGMMIWQQWPVSGLWVIGTFIGIDLVFNGWSLIMLGLAGKRLSADKPA